MSSEDQKCSVKWCDHMAYTKGLCAMHYQRQRRTGSLYGAQARKTNEELDRVREMLTELVYKEGYISLQEGEDRCGYCNRDVGYLEGSSDPHHPDCPVNKAIVYLKSLEN